MKCPNCGKTIRSKNQCVHCGYVFNSNAKQTRNTPKQVDAIDTKRENDTFRSEKEPVEFESVTINSRSNQNESTQNESTNDAYEEVYVYNEPKQPSGCRRVFSFLLKLVLAVLVVFLLFYYGPTLYNKAMNLINGNDQTEQTTESTSNQNESAEPVKSEQGQNEATSESSEEAAEGSNWNFETNTDNYPVIRVAMTPEEPVGSIDGDTFTFELENGNTGPQEITDYSLTPEGDQLILSFRDPALNVLSTEPQPQTLTITSESLNVSEEISYDIPSEGLDQATIDQYNEIINSTFDGNEDVTAFINTNDENSAPFIYDDQTKEAGSLISWYIIERVYQAIEENELSLEDTIPLNSALMAEGDTAPLSMVEPDAEYTVEELLDLMIQDQDLTAMNHLIQEVGGPNQFNIWLNEHNYFSTRVNNLLSLSPDGQVAGAMTNVQDLGQLLQLLSNDELVSSEASEMIKEKLLQSPETAKYPSEGIEGVERRYELASSDDNAQQQYYSGILESEDGNHIIIMMANSYDEAENIVAKIQSALADIMNKHLSNGEQYESSEESSEETEESTEATVPVEEAPSVAETPVESEAAGYTESVEQYAPENPAYYSQYVQGQDRYVELPDRSIVNANGQRIEPTWFFDEESQTYRYTFE